MAYICEKPAGSCALCEHYRFDEEKGRKVCFAAVDKCEAEKKAAELKVVASKSGCDKAENTCISCEKYVWDDKVARYVCLEGEDAARTATLPSRRYAMLFVNHSPIGEGSLVDVCALSFDTLDEAREGVKLAKNAHTHVSNQLRGRRGLFPFAGEMLSDEECRRVFGAKVLCASSLYYTDEYDASVKARAFSYLAVETENARDVIRRLLHHNLDCGTCQTFVDEGCETYHDCPYHGECAKLGDVWVERKAV